MKLKEADRSFGKTIEIMFPAMKFCLNNGFKQTVKFFIYDLAELSFIDYLPKFFVSEKVSKNPRLEEVLIQSSYKKSKIYNILNNDNMRIHEEHMTPNSQFQNKILEYDNYKIFEEFIRNNYAIAIITKEENQKLDKAGLKSNRSNLKEAFLAYEKMNIRLREIKFVRK
jgi:asparagine N-glycosylation enzyme membrane subunit Stt3